MRSFGSHRGNPALRFMIEQTARRRLWAQLGPERPSLIDPASGHHAERWSRPFFERFRAIARNHFAPVAELPEGALAYFGAPHAQLWSLVSEHALVIALDHEDSRVKVAERARRWQACLNTRTTPGLASAHWGHPVYGARLDPLTGELDVVWAFQGDWCELALASETPERKWDTPDHWRAVAEERA